MTAAIPEACSGYAPEPPRENLALVFDSQPERLLATLPPDRAQELSLLIRRILALDPRPGYRRGQAEQRRYGMRLMDYEVRWEVDRDAIRVVQLAPAQTPQST